MEYWKILRNRVGNIPLMLMAAGIIVADEKGSILLQKRADANSWGIPGGMMDYGESAEETAIREFYEETGLEIAIEDMIGIYTKYFHKYDNGDEIQMCSVFFRGKIAGGTLKADNDETIELKYFDWSHLPEIFHPQHEEAIEDYFQEKINVYR